MKHRKVLVCTIAMVIEGIMAVCDVQNPAAYAGVSSIAAFFCGGNAVEHMKATPKAFRNGPPPLKPLPAEDEA